MGQTRSLSKAQHRLQVNLHTSLVCIITIGPAGISSLGDAGAPRVFKLEILVMEILYYLSPGQIDLEQIYM